MAHFAIAIVGGRRSDDTTVLVNSSTDVPSCSIVLVVEWEDVMVAMLLIADMSALALLV